jgi:hypothetical protein
VRRDSPALDAGAVYEYAVLAAEGTVAGGVHAIPSWKICQFFLRRFIKSMYFWYALVFVGLNPSHRHQ